MRKRIFGTFLTLLAATSACSAILGDFTVGGTDATTPDAGGGTTESGATDGATVADAAVDAPASDAGCPTGQTACPSGCANLQSAATNCGVCGHDCRGGTCGASKCSAYVVAKQPTTGTVAKIATDGTRVLWADTGIVAIEQIPAKGGAVVTLVPVSTANGGVGSELALANGIVAFDYVGGTNPPSVGIAAVDMANSGAAVFPGTLAVSAISLNHSGTRVIYVNAHGTASDLFDCALVGRTAGACGPGVGGGRFAAQTAADDSYVFLDLTQANIIPSQSGLYLATIKTDVASIFITDVAASLAVDGTWAYWTVSIGGGATYAVKRTLEASPGTQLQTPVASIASHAFATDGANVYYWTGSAVAARPVAGGSETILAPATTFTEIAVGGGLLVWTDGATISGIALP
jgi:hypothetical protein